MKLGKKSRIVFQLLLLVLLATACSKVPYHGTLRNWTRGDKIYSFNYFAAKIIWDATYMSPEFRATARDQIAEWKKIPDNEWTDYPSYLTDTEEGVFLVSIYLPKGYPPINTNPDKFWNFTLDLPDGRSIVPSSIETVNVTIREEKLFPYINRWSQFYRIKFPVAYLDKPFQLALRSAGVTSFLAWEEKTPLQKSSAPQTVFPSHD